MKEMRIAFSNGLILGYFLSQPLAYTLWSQKEAFCIRLCCIRLYRSCVTFSNGDLRCRRYLYPTFFKKINVDPAVASGPLITTVNDLVAVVSYYGLSWILLINVLHLAG